MANSSNPIFDKLYKQAQNSVAEATGVDLPEFTVGLSDEEKEAAVKKAGQGPQVSTSESLKTVRQAMLENNERIRQYSQELDAASFAESQASGIIEEATKVSTGAFRTISAVTQNAQLEAQNDVIESFDAAGGSKELKRLMGVFDEDADRVEELMDRSIDIADDKFTRIPFIDNIINDLRSEQHNTILQAAIAKQQQTASKIATMTSATEAIHKVENLTAKTINDATIDANLQLITAEGAEKLSEQRIKNAQSNAARVAQSFAMSSAELSNVIDLYKLEGQAVDRKMQQQNLELNTENLAFQRKKMDQTIKVWAEESELRTINLEKSKVQLEATKLALREGKAISPARLEKARLDLDRAQREEKEIKDTQASLTSAVKYAQSLSGTKVEDNSTITWGLRQPGATGERYRRLVEIGTYMSVPVGGEDRPVIGLTPYDAQRTLTLVSPSGNYTQNKGTKLLDEISIKQQAKYADAAGTQTPPKTETEAQVNFNTTAAEIIKEYSSNIKTGDSSNPFHAPPMSVLTDKSKAIRNTTLYKEVLAPREMKEFNPENIIQAAVEGIQTGKVSPSKAVLGIATIFSAAVDYNNSQDGGLVKYGFPVQSSYNVTLQRPRGVPELMYSALKLSPLAAAGVAPPALYLQRKNALGNTSINIDMLDPVQVQHIINLRLAAPKTSPESDVQ